MGRRTTIPDDVFEALIRASGSERAELAERHGISVGYAQHINTTARAIRLRHKLGLPSRSPESKLIAAIQRGDA